jgi:hypothetical protein
MKDNKTIFLIVLSILLLIVSMALLWTWGYNYGSDKKKKSASTLVAQDSITNENIPSKEKVERMYLDAVGNLNILDSALHAADAAKSDIGDKLNEFYRLRDEIAALLKNSDNNSLLSAQQKIGELQFRVEVLRKQNALIEKENKRLAEILNQLSRIKNKETLMAYDSLSAAVSNSDIIAAADLPSTQLENQQPATTSVPTSAVKVSAFSVSAVSGQNAMDEPTTKAQLTSKLSGSLSFQNNNRLLQNAELMIVVLQPDGKVLKTSAWGGAGSFESNGVRKIYSSKIRFDCTENENKQLFFNIEADEFQKGNYFIQLYFKGMLVSKTTLTLS